MGGEGSRDFWRVLIAYFLPPVGVFLQVGMGVPLWINIALTIFVPWIGGMLHALWVITTTGPNGEELADGGGDFFRILVASFLPPVGVFLQVGLAAPFWINLVLTMCGGLPGVLHALWVITSRD